MRGVADGDVTAVRELDRIENALIPQDECAIKSVKKMMDFIEANHARDNQVNRDDIVQQGGNDEDQDAGQK